MSTPYRTNLRFDSYEQLLTDVQTLHATGWEKSGQWSLATICDHQTRWINGMLGGGPGDNLPRIPRPFHWLVRLIVRRMVRKQKYPSIQFPAPKGLAPAADLSEPDAIAALAAAVARLQQLTGPTVQTHPFGPIPADDFRGLALLHAAHHLAFLRGRVGG